MFAVRKAMLLAGIFSAALASLDGSGGAFEDADVFEATVPFVEIGRWVIGLKPFPQALVGVDFLGYLLEKGMEGIGIVLTRAWQ